MARANVSSLADPSRDAGVLPLLEQIHSRIAHGLLGLADGPRAVWGPDHENDPHPTAARLRERGVGFEWVVVTFPGWSLWDLHVGLVPRGPDALALGLHWHQSLSQAVPPEVARLAALAVSAEFRTRSSEYHADLLVLAWRSLPPNRTVQVLSDVALELALGLRATLAYDLAHRSPHPPKEPLHDL